MCGLATSSPMQAAPRMLPRSGSPVRFRLLPGGSGTVQAERLVRVARKNGLDWDNPRNISPGAGFPGRSAHRRRRDQRHDRRNHWTSRSHRWSPARSFDVTFTSDQAPLYVPSDAVPVAEVVQLRYSKRSGHFTAVIAAPAGDPAAKRRSYTGRAVEVSIIAVPVHNMRPRFG